MERCSSEVPGGASTTRKSNAPHSVSFRNCLMSPFFRGPRQITASSGSGSRKPMDITARFSVTYTGCHPLLLLCTSWPSWWNMMGALGPQMSMSSKPTSFPASAASPYASCEANVLFPTPPLPESTKILCFTSRRRSATATTSGSTPLGAVAHACWLGHPAHAAARPAASAFVPGHDSFASAGTSGAGASVVIAPAGGTDAIDAVWEPRARGVRRWRPDPRTTSRRFVMNFSLRRVKSLQLADVDCGAAGDQRVCGARNRCL